MPYPRTQSFVKGNYIVIVMTCWVVSPNYKLHVGRNDGLAPHYLPLAKINESVVGHTSLICAGPLDAHAPGLLRKKVILYSRSLTKTQVKRLIQLKGYEIMCPVESREWSSPLILATFLGGEPLFCHQGTWGREVKQKSYIADETWSQEGGPHLHPEGQTCRFLGCSVRL